MGKILIVDDDLESLKLIGMILQSKGHQIVAARTGSQALEKAVAEKPDLIILDIMMPGMDGYEVCKHLRADPQTSAIPVIMFTARTQLADKVAGFEAGADEYLTKPIHPSELIARVEALLARVARLGALTRPALRAKVIGFLGCKGGVGTTTLTVNVGIALVRGPAKEKRVALLEFQLARSTMALQLGLTPRGGLQALLQQPVGMLNPETIQAQMERHATGLAVLAGAPSPAGLTDPVPPVYVGGIVRHLGTVTDFVLVDMGADLGEANQALLKILNYLVLVVEPNRIALTLAQAMLASLEQQGLSRHRIGIVILHHTHSAVTLGKEAVENFLQQEVKAMISPAPELAFQAAEQGMPMLMVQPQSVAAMQFRQLAEFLASL